MARLDVGDSAPSFTFESVNKGSVSLGDSRMVLIFGRYFGCPVCQLDFDELLKRSSYIKVRAELVYFTQSSAESARGYIRDYAVDFPVVSVPKEDGKYRLYDAYGVGRMGIGTTVEILRRANTAKKLDKVHGAYEGSRLRAPLISLWRMGRLSGLTGD